jgi:hypothetical protein
MSINIGEALKDGAKRTVATNGLYFIVIMWVLSVINGILGNTVAGNLMEQFPDGMGPGGPPALGPSLGLSPGIAVGLSLIIGLVSILVGAAALRTFVSDVTDTIPTEHFTRNAVWMVLNLIVGGIVFGIIVAIGFVLLIIPGIFLLVSLFFWNLYVVVEDQNFIDGLQNSWALTKGNRLMLFVLGVLVIIITAVLGGIFGIPQVFVGGFVGLVISQLGSAIGTVFGVATAARTYNQLISNDPAAS